MSFKHCSPTLTLGVIFLSVLTFFTLTACGVYESSPLIVSIRSNNENSVRSMIESGEDVNALSLDLIEQQYWEITPLIRATILGNIEIVEMLLDAGAEVNGRDEWGATALMAAVAFGHVEATKLLIKKGANLDATKPDQTTALMIAARKGNFEIVKILLDSGADVNIGIEGDTALSLAAWEGYTSVVKLLIRNGAEVTNMALSRARKNKNYEIIRLLENTGTD